MKKLKYLLLIVLLMPFIVSATTGSSTIDENTCKNIATAASGGKGISSQLEYIKCYRAGCSTFENGTWNKINQFSDNYYCTNGNDNPYITVTSDGCKPYSGTCNAETVKWCTTVSMIDCTRKKDGTAYSGATTPVVPKPDKKKSSESKQSQPRRTSGGSRVIIPTTEKKNSETTGRPVVPTDPTTTTTTEPVPSSNLNVTKITLNGTDIKYRNEYSEYTIKLKKGIRDLDVVVEVEDPNTEVYVEGSHNMPDEDTTISIIVEAENGVQKIITINVKRYEGESSDCNIANIAITDYEINHFDKNNFEYTLNVKGKTKALNMEIIPSDPLHAIYEVQGNEKLENNSVVTIQVKAEDGNMCYYHIKIRKTSSFWLILFIIIIVTIGLLLAGYFVYRYLKRSKNQYEYE